MELIFGRWANAALVVGGALLLLMLLRWHLDSRNRYDVRDLLLDHGSGRASIDKHILLAMAVLSIWVVVVRTLAGKDVETLLLGVMGILIVQRSATAAIDKFGGKRQQDELRDVQRKE